VPQRAHLIALVSDAAGNVQGSRTAYVYEYGTTTPYTDPIYNAKVGGSILTQPLTANGNGILEAWADFGRSVTIAPVGGGSSVTGEFKIDDADPRFQTIAVRNGRPWVDVDAFGAVADGNRTFGDTTGTDNTAAFIAAMTAAYNQTGTTGYGLRLGPNVYNVTDLQIANVIHGAGIFNTVLKRIGSRCTGIQLINGAGGATHGGSGTGYTSAPTVTLRVGASAAGTAVLTGDAVTSVTMTNNGSNYNDGSSFYPESLPPVTFSDPPSVTGARTATGRAIINGSGQVSGITVLDGGAKYVTPPTVTVSPSGSGATAICTINAFGEVASLTLTARGSGYTTDPEVVFSGGGGAGAVGRAHCAFITEQNTTSGAQAAQVTNMTIDGNGYLGTDLVNLGFASPLAGAAMAITSRLENLWLQDAKNGWGLKVNTNVASASHLWVMRNRLGLYQDGSTFYADTINCEGSRDGELYVAGAYSRFTKVQTESSYSKTGIIRFGAFAHGNEVDAYLPVNAQNYGDGVHFDAGSYDNGILVTGAFAGKPIGGYILNDLNDITSGAIDFGQFTYGSLGQVQSFSYHQGRSRTVFGGGATFGRGSNDHIRQHTHIIPNVGGAAQTVQAHPILANPGGICVVHDGTVAVALYALLTSGTALIYDSTGGSGFATSLTASKACLYVTGGVLKLTNNTAVNNQTYALTFICGPIA
jgi:hypothetical protein